jgi:hypothetical protein
VKGNEAPEKNLPIRMKEKRESCNPFFQPIEPYYFKSNRKMG